MKKMKAKIVQFFTTIDYLILGKSFQEVLWLTLIALGPIIINITIASIPANSIIEAFKNKIVPGEILSYCLSFIAPSLYFLLTKTQGTGYKLPLLHTFSIITLLVYGCSLVLYLITKNHWVQEINLEPQRGNLFFKLTLTFLVITIIFRIYSLYHSKNIFNLNGTRQRQQDDFNTQFIESLK